MGRWRAWALTLLLSLVMAGCSAAKPLEVAGATRLNEAKFKGGRATLWQKGSGEPIVSVWTESGKEGLLEGKVLSRTPLIGWIEGVAFVAGSVGDEQADQVEMLTSDRQVLKGKLQNGTFLLAWPSASQSPGLFLRVVDKKGQEIYHWPVSTAA